MAIQYSNPWIDLSSYTLETANRFKGRFSDIEKFRTIVSSGCMSALYANSGIGKSSFIDAGISPIFIAEGYFPIHIVFPDIVFTKGYDIRKWFWDYLKNDICCINNNNKEEKVREWKFLFAEEDRQARKNGFKNLFAACEGDLWWLLHAFKLTDIATGAELKPLIIFDQFEEVFVKTENNKQFLTDIFDIVDSISPNSFSVRVRNMLEQIAEKNIFINLQSVNDYKVIFALRKEYLSDFDYWTNELHRISDLQRNRMHLQPMTRQQAEEVITRQPLLDAHGHAIEGKRTETLIPVKNQILDFIDVRKRGEIEPFLLSVVCSRLFDDAAREGEKEVNEEKLNALNIKTIIKDFYEDLIKHCLEENFFPDEDDVIELENILVSQDDKHRIRASVRDKELHALLEKLAPVPEKEKVLKEGEEEEKERSKETHFLNFLKQLEDIHLIRVTSDSSIEIVHDRVAEVIYERQRQRKAALEGKKRNILSVTVRFLLLCATLIGTMAAIYHAVNRQKDSTPYNSLTKMENLELTTSDTIWAEVHDSLNFTIADNSLVETFSVTDNQLFINIKNCYVLKTISIDKFKGERLFLNVMNCPQLSDIIVRCPVQFIQYNLSACPKVQVHINDNVKDINITDKSDPNLSFKIESKNYLWKDSVLWDMREDNERIVYASGSVPDIIPFPLNYTKSSLYCNGKRQFTNRRKLIWAKGDSLLRINDEQVRPSHVKNKDVEEIILGDSVEYIAPYTFKGLKNLRKVRFGKNVSYIDKEAFASCPLLDSLVLPCNSLFLGDRAFANCSSLRYIEFPQNVSFPISEYKQDVTVLLYATHPFLECHNISSAILPDTCNLSLIDGMLYLRDIPIMPLSENVKCKNPDFIIEGQSIYRKMQSRQNTIFPCWLAPDCNLDFKSYSSIARYNQDACFLYAYDGQTIVIPKKGVTSLQLPSTSLRGKLSFYSNIENLRTIHIPFPQPEGLLRRGREGKILSKLELEMDESVKERITLVVPAGCKQYYDNYPPFRVFKEIIEEGNERDIYLSFVQGLALNTKMSMTKDPVIGYLFMLAIPLLMVLVYWLRKRHLIKNERQTHVKASSLKFAIGITCLALIVYTIAYHVMIVYIRLSILSYSWSEIVFNTAALLLSILFCAFYIYLPSIVRGMGSHLKMLTAHFISLYQHLKRGLIAVGNFMLRNWKMCVVTLMIIAIGYAGVLWYMKLHDPIYAIKHNKIEKAIRLYSRQLSQQDSISAEEQTLLRSLLVKNLSIPDVPDSSVFRMNSWRISDEKLYLTTDSGYFCYDFQKRSRIKLPEGDCTIEYSPTGKYIISHQDPKSANIPRYHNIIFGSSVIDSIPYYDSFEWTKDDKSIIHSNFGSCEIKDLIKGETIMRWDSVDVQSFILYDEVAGTVIVPQRIGFFLNPMTGNYDDSIRVVVYDMNVGKSQMLMTTHNVRGILSHKYLVTSKGWEDTRLYNLSNLKPLHKTFKGRCIGISEDEAVDRFVCMNETDVFTYELDDNGFKATKIPDSKAVWLNNPYVEKDKAHVRYLLIQRKNTGYWYLYHLEKKKLFALPLSPHIECYLNYIHKRAFYLTDSRVNRSYLFELTKEKPILRLTSQIGRTRMGTTSRSCRYFDDDGDRFCWAENRTMILPKTEVDDYFDAGYLRKETGNDYLFYPVGEPVEDGFVTWDSYPEMVSSGWALIHHKDIYDKKILINTKPLHVLIQACELIPDEVKTCLLSKIKHQVLGAKDEEASEAIHVQTSSNRNLRNGRRR